MTIPFKHLAILLAAAASVECPIYTPRNDNTPKGVCKPVTPKGQPVGRNALCPCGSGKKFKKCCMRN